MIRLFSKFRRRDWICLAAAVVFIVAQVWLDLKMPDYMSEITTLVQTPGSEMAAVLAAGAKMLACALGSLCSALMVAQIPEEECLPKFSLFLWGRLENFPQRA